MPHYVSRKFLNTDFSSPPTLDEKIKVFEDRVLGWQIEIAEEIRSQIESGGENGAFRHAGYALVTLLFSYFEMIAQYIEGTSSNGGSKATFLRGFCYVFPATSLSSPEIEEVYKRVRCGMYHDGYTKFGTLISGNFSPTVSLENSTVKVNPHTLVDDISAHFVGYIATLNTVTNVAERTKFENTFDRGTTAGT
jgi:hypothetical protein